MKTFALLMFVAATALSTSGAALAQNYSEDIQSEQINVLREVKSAQLEIDRTTAPIHSKAQLLEHLAHNPTSPIFSMPDNLRNRFLKSLVFTKYGLASYSYLELRQLNVTDAYKILSLFGAQQDVGTMPGLRARNSSEEAMMLMSYLPSNSAKPVVPSIRDPDIKNYYCHVEGGQGTWCVHEYGSYCASGCL